MELELYTDEKDIVLEKRLEQLLTISEIAYEKSETWIPSEQLYEVLYKFDEVPTGGDSERLSTETVLNLTLAAEHISQKYIELPHDCDVSKAVTLFFEGVLMQEGTAWQMSEKDAPERDRIVWEGLELDGLLQTGDKVSITYYKKG